MDGRMQHDIASVCPTVAGNSNGGRDMDQWYDNRRIHAPPQHMQSSAAMSYYKCQNEIVDEGAVSEMPVAAHWWKEGLVFLNAPPGGQKESCAARCATETPKIAEGSQEVSKKPSKAGTVRKTKSSKEQKDSTKRTKHPETWKVNVKKNARLRGEEYVGVGGKIVPAKVMGPPCDCRMRCSEKIDEAAREELHNVFWKTCTWEQRRQYIALLVKESAKQRSRCRSDVKSEHRRQVTFTYSLLMKSDFITVCKPMFLSTFSVSEKLVRLAMDKKRTSPGGIIGPDQRGRHTPKTKKAEAVKDLVREHIKSFPAEGVSNPMDHSGRKYLDASLSIAAMHKLYVKKCEETGVPESDIVKESYYRDMFKNEFNLGFKSVEEKVKAPQVSSYNNASNKL